MDNILISKRYATAIYEIAQKKNIVFQVFEMLNLLLEHIQKDPDFKKFLIYPVISTEDKKALVNRIYKDIDNETLEILDYLIDKDRLLYIKSIYEQYTKIYYEDHKKLIVLATFPKELSKSQKDKLEEKLKKLKSKDVIIHYIVDENLIGGGIIKINDDIIDGSIRTQIDNIKL